MTRSRSLPQHARAATAIERGARFEGVIPVRNLSRLVETLADNTGEIQADLSLRRELTGAALLHGRLQGRLMLKCQRCLQAFEWPLDAPLDLRLVRSEAEEAKHLQDSEPYLIEDDVLPLHQLVEDEALLALPFSARCPDCSNA